MTETAFFHAAIAVAIYAVSERVLLATLAGLAVVYLAAVMTG